MKETELKKKVESSSGSEKVMALINYSDFLRQSDFEHSRDFAEEALQLAKEIGDMRLEIRAITSLAYTYFYCSKFEKAREYADEIVEKGIETGSKTVIGSAYNIQARIAFKSGNPASALELFLKALEHYLQKPVPLNLMSCYNNLGMTHLHLKNTEEANNYYKLALEQSEILNHPARETILMNIGNIHYNKEEYEEAMSSYLRAEEMFRANNLLTNLGNVYYNIALTYHRQEKEKESLEYFRKSYEMQKKINDPKGICTISHTIGTTLMEINKFEEAEEYLNESLSLAEEHDLKWNIVNACQSFAYYWEHFEDYRKVCEYQRREIELKDEMNQEINREKLSEMEAKYKTEIYKLRSSELDAKNKSMSEQLASLNTSMDTLREMHQQLKDDFQGAVSKINKQDNLLSAQSRMAIMGEMISMIGHQWRQPLNVIGVLVQSFQDAWEFNELNEEFIEKQVNVVMEQIQYMSDTISDFRDFFNTDYTSVFLLEDTIAKSLHLADFSLNKSGVKVIKEFQGNCKMIGNPNEIIQVILNIINNAIEAMETDSIAEPEIKIRLLEKNDEIILGISNKGKPVPKELMNKLFEPYFTTKGSKGTGIGLYICKMIIENKYHGKLEAQKIEDGIEFLIKLPVLANEPV